jgi:hypothetical protein
MRRTLLVATLGGVFYSVLVHCVASWLRSDLGDWPALVGWACGSICGAVASAAEYLVQAVETQTAYLTAITEKRQQPRTPPGGGRPPTGIQTVVSGRLELTDRVASS